MAKETNSKPKATKAQQNGKAELPIDRVRKAYKTRRRSMVVKEWGDLELFFAPLTTDTMVAVEERMQDVDGKDAKKHRHEQNIYLIIATAELEDGSPAFRWGDKAYLMAEADYMVVQQIVAFIYATGRLHETVEDAKGKSNATPASASA